MKRVTCKGRANGLLGVIDADYDEAARLFHCLHCPYTTSYSADLFDHTAWRHPFKVRGESSQKHPTVN